MLMTWKTELVDKMVRDFINSSLIEGNIYKLDFNATHPEGNHIPLEVMQYYTIYKACLEANIALIVSQYSGALLKKSPLLYCAITALDSLSIPYFLISKLEEST